MAARASTDMGRAIALDPLARVNRRPRRKGRKEKSLEVKCCDWARDELGLLSRKMNGLGFNCWPDRIFAPRKVSVEQQCKLRQGKHAPLLWVEFKHLGEEPTKGQADLHADLRARGQQVEVCDDFEQFKRTATRFAKENS